ncbi:unnamed protein product [Caenorhabditis auriculariae]|uniref:Uncharacterized protein n=1 Tax=Caenorhabditis auriculariae TaxID=2777116 RepID=A0A8S1HB90_9PELO|nr:unnamed protein product [Caenorhabditis auriculariae]
MMSHYFACILLLSVFIFDASTAKSTEDAVVSSGTKKLVQKMVTCITPVDTVLAAKVAECTDDVCVRTARQYTKKAYPVDFTASIQPCLNNQTAETTKLGT